VNELDEETAAALERLRRNIDEVDAVLVKLLNQRAQWALDVGEVKSGAGVPIYQPGREAEVLAGVGEGDAVGVAHQDVGGARRQLGVEVVGDRKSVV
jgi:chorismate mutase/prephenate dehydratase